jgi:phosphatidate cytidylyltransferase
LLQDLSSPPLAGWRISPPSSGNAVYADGPPKTPMDHLFSISRPFAHPVTLWIVAIAGAVLVLTLPIVFALGKAGSISPKTRADVWTRHKTWMVLAPAIVVPVLLCAASAMALLCVLSLLCYREFARATGLFRHRLLSAIVAAAIVALFLAAADNWYRLFVAITPLAVTILVAAAVLQDQPKGYLQRVSLATIGFILFGVCLGHLAYLANDEKYRPILCMILVCAQGADVSAYICGKALGKRKLFPNTSPNKTLAGHAGALLFVTPLAAWLAHLVFPGTALDTPLHLIILGLIIAVGAQLGDLMLGSIKRDLGLKDFASTLPGHGGFTDRCNSLLLISPAVFHYVNYFVGVGAGRPVRVLF